MYNLSVYYISSSLGSLLSTAGPPYLWAQDMCISVPTKPIAKDLRSNQKPLPVASGGVLRASSHGFNYPQNPGICEWGVELIPKGLLYTERPLSYPRVAPFHNKTKFASSTYIYDSSSLDILGGKKSLPNLGGDARVETQTFHVSNVGSTTELHGPSPIRPGNQTQRCAAYVSTCPRDCSSYKQEVG